MIAPDMVPSVLGFLGVQVGSLGPICIFNPSEPYLVIISNCLAKIS